MWPTVRPTGRGPWPEAASPQPVKMPQRQQKLLVVGRLPPGCCDVVGVVGRDVAEGRVVGVALVRALKRALRRPGGCVGPARATQRHSWK